MANDHALFFGQIGPRGNEVASGLARDSDLILAIGTRLGFNTTFYTNNEITQGVKIVQVDIEPLAIGRHYPIALGVIGDAGAVAGALADAMADDSPAAGAAARIGAAQEARTALWAERDAAADNARTPLSAERCFFELRQALPRDTIVSLDAGTMCMQATDQLRHYTPPGLVAPLDMGLVGGGYASGLGAKAAAPERPVVSISGDGGFGMTLAEISTAVQHGLNTVAVVFDNGCWGAEKAYQKDFYNGRFIGSDIISPPYDQVAELCGAKGYAVSQPGELADAVAEALKDDAPAVVHAKTDPDAMVSFRKDAFKHRGAQ
jgi:acetolactate synthase-1/2/3 large subunit/sulfoacetaldehyde acetyltransferase